jgi:transposase/biotin operon repressor
MPAPTAPALAVTPQQRQVLETWTRSRVLPHRLVQRAQLVLLASEGVANETIARRLGVSRAKVARWRRRFEEAGVNGLEEARGRGRRATYGRAFVEEVVSTPLQPHLTRTFTYRRDPLLAEKVSEVVGRYMNPPENAIVLSVDEKSPIQALDRTQPLPMKPPQVERRPHDSKRYGTTTPFAALDVATGAVTGACYEQHRGAEVLAFLKLLVRTYPRQHLHLIVDNASSHQTPEVQEWLRKHRRLHLHFTPTSSSWLNQVETWFSILSRRVIRRGVFTSVKALIEAIERFLSSWNERCQPFVWVKSPSRFSPN